MDIKLQPNRSQDDNNSESCEAPTSTTDNSFEYNGNDLVVSDPPMKQMNDNETEENLPEANLPAVSLDSSFDSFIQDSDESSKFDKLSQRGRFGWVTLGKTFHLPCLIRHSEEKFCAVRMAESTLLSSYLESLRPDIYGEVHVQGVYATEAEAKLLNEINNDNCESQFGKQLFTEQDLLVSVNELHKFYNFVSFCHEKLYNKKSDEEKKCGFIRIDYESVIPYVIKNNVKYVPLFYFICDDDNSTEIKKSKIESFELAYLKFCCKLQCVREHYYDSDVCSVITLDDLKSYFPSGTNFEEFWPSKEYMVGCQEKLILQFKEKGTWVRTPEQKTSNSDKSPPSSEESPESHPAPLSPQPPNKSNDDKPEENG